MSILGYLFNLETTYGWGTYTQMSLQTAIGFVAFCVGWLGLIAFYSKLDNKGTYRIPVFCGLALLIVTLIFTNALNKQSISTESIISIVFWFGILMTISVVFFISFLQSTIEQSRKWKKQEQDKNNFKSELERSHLTLKLASDVAELGTWSWNVDTDVLIWNERMFEMYETPDSVRESGLLFDYWYQSVHPEDRDKAASSLQKAVEEMQSWRTEFRLLFDGNRVKYIKASAICVVDHATQSTLVIGGNLDVTQERKMQLELEEKTQQAELSSLAKSHFLANMSHEIRTPMNGILGIGDLLAVTRLDSKQSEYLGIMMSSANKLLSLLNDILDISKIEAGEMRLETLCVPLEEVIGDTLKSLAIEAHSKGLDYHYIKDNNVPEWVFTDPIRLGQILSNLVSNAIKFTENGEVLVAIKAEPQQEDIGDTVIVNFEVSDSGIGLDQAQIESIFKPFAQADESTTRKYGGTGLGLSIVQQIIKLFNGDLNVESELGKGTKVTFSIPMHVGTRKDLSTAITTDYTYYVENYDNALKSMNCLVVDSNEINRNWLISMLHSWQCNVSGCMDTNEALTLVKESIAKKLPFDAIIIEQKKQSDEANKCIKDVKKIYQSNNMQEVATIIVMTSNNISQGIESPDSNTNNYCLFKPIKQSEVFNALMSVLGKKDSTAQALQSIGDVGDNKRLNVLVAEDHVVNQYLIREILEKRGHKVTIVENGRLAIEALENDRYSAIVMDVQMPIMDGLTATKLIRKGNNQADICIIGLTAKALKEDKYICLEAGMNHYLSKPTNPTELITALESLSFNNKVKLDLKNVNQVDDKSDNNSTATYRTLDIERCLLTTGDDTELLRKMLQLTIENIEPIVSSIDSLKEQHNWRELAKAVHKAKGMLANFCTEELVTELEELIEKAEANNINYKEIIEDLNQATEQIVIFNLEIVDYLENNNWETVSL
ncbi:hypothetical protein GCM10009114_27920 [Aliiglaciecola litoralis]|uniref:histidine kinase n=1 Tax=Aliiglaciecola litoralis TaxID=582857 RepID=A0ABN1LNU0_9ALTE